MKQQSVIADHKNSLGTLRLNFMRSLQEYNVIQSQLRARDKLKEQYDKNTEKIRKIVGERSHPDNQTPSVQLELNNRVSRAQKEME